MTSNTVATAVRSIFKDEDISDIKLKGADDECWIPALRGILASRSPVFRRMLYGDFSEASSSLICFGDWNCETIEAIVEFCYTDNLEMMQDDVNEELSRKLIDILAAAHFFELSVLEDKIFEWMSEKIDIHCSLACLVINELLSKGLTDHALLKCAQFIVQMTPRASLIPEMGSVGKGVLSLDERSIESVLGSISHIVSEMTLFLALKMWRDLGRIDSDGEDDGSVGESRHDFTRRMATRFIDLSKIKPSCLDSIVRESGLFDEDAIAVAYKQQAFQSERNGTFYSNKKQKNYHACVARVDVKGSGIPVVNGAYFVCGEKSGEPTYIKKSIKDGELEVCRLRFNMSKSSTKRWFIQLNESCLFYSYVTSFKDYIPKQGWKMWKGNDRGPAPTLSYKEIETPDSI